jgi:hypothetical protein
MGLYLFRLRQCFFSPAPEAINADGIVSCGHPRAEQSRAWTEQLGLAKKPQDYMSVTLPTQKPGAIVRVDSDFTEEL